MRPGGGCCAASARAAAGLPRTARVSSPSLPPSAPWPRPRTPPSRSTCCVLAAAPPRPPCTTEPRTDVAQGTRQAPHCAHPGAAGSPWLGACLDVQPPATTGRRCRHKRRAGQDYFAAAGKLHFEQGEYSKSITVQIAEGKGYQGRRTFSVLLTAVDNGVLGEHCRTMVTILETDQRFLARLLNSMGFGIILTLATLFTLFGSDIALLKLSKNWDPVLRFMGIVVNLAPAAYSGVAIFCMFIFLLEILGLAVVKRWNYLFTTIFFMDVIAIVGLFFYLPILPRVSWSTWLGQADFSILVIARAARAARTGSQLGQQFQVVPHTLRFFKRCAKYAWRVFRRCVPKPIKLVVPLRLELSDSGLSSEEDEMVAEVGAQAPNREAIGAKDGEGGSGKGGGVESGDAAAVAAVGLTEFLSVFLPSGSQIGIAIVEFIVGRVILMLMLLVIFAIVILPCRLGEASVHDGALAYAATMPANSTAAVGGFLSLYVAYVKTQGQSLVYLKVGGRVVQASEVEALTCGRSTISPQKLEYLREWWLFVVAPRSTPGVNNVTALQPVAGGTVLSPLCAAELGGVDDSRYACPSSPEAAFHSSDCDTFAIVDDSEAVTKEIRDNLYLTLALVAILGIGAAVVAADVQRMFLSPIVKLFAAMKLLTGAERKKKRRQRRQEERRAEDEEGGGGGNGDEGQGRSSKPSASVENIVKKRDPNGREAVAPALRAGGHKLSAANGGHISDSTPAALTLAALPPLADDVAVAATSSESGSDGGEEQDGRRTWRWRRRRGSRRARRPVAVLTQGAEVPQSKVGEDAQGAALQSMSRESRGSSTVTLARRCPGSPPWEGPAASADKEDVEKSLPVAVWERLCRIMAINTKDLKVMVRSLDKVENAFGWRLLELRQWVGDVVKWNEMCAVIGASLAKGFREESLTLGELRSKVALLANSMHLPAWAAHSIELRFVARCFVVAGKLVGEQVDLLEEKGLAILQRFGLEVEKRESVSVAMLTRCCLAAILRYKLLQKMGEPIPTDFSNMTLQQLLNFVNHLLRRKLRQHLESSGLTVHPSFEDIPLAGLWGASWHLKAHALYHRIKEAGLPLGRAAAVASSKATLRPAVKSSFKKSVIGALRSYGVEERISLGVDLDQLREKVVGIRLVHLPLVAACLAALQELPSEEVLADVLQPIDAAVAALGSPSSWQDEDCAAASGHGCDGKAAVCQGAHSTGPGISWLLQESVDVSWQLWSGAGSDLKREIGPWEDLRDAALEPARQVIASAVITQVERKLRSKGWRLPERSSGQPATYAGLFASVRSAVREEVRQVLLRHGLLSCTVDKAGREIQLDHLVRLGTSAYIGQPPPFARLTAFLRDATDSELRMFLGQNWRYFQQEAAEELSAYAGQTGAGSHGRLPGLAEAPGVRSQVDKFVKVWMMDRLTAEGLAPPPGFTTLTVEDAVIVGEQLFLKEAQRRLECLDLPLLSSGLGTATNWHSDIAATQHNKDEASEEDPLEALLSHLEQALYDEVVIALGPLRVPSSRRPPEAPHHCEGLVDTAIQCVLVDVERAAALVEDAGRGAWQVGNEWPRWGKPDDVGDGDKDTGGEDLEDLLWLSEWMGSPSCVASGIQEGKISPSASGLMSHVMAGINALVPLTREQAYNLFIQGLTAVSHLVSKRMARSSLLGHLPPEVLAESDFDSLDSLRAALKLHARHVPRGLDLRRTWPQRHAGEVLAELGKEVPAGLESTSDEQFNELEIAVKLSEIPMVQKHMDAFALLPSFDDDIDDLRKAIMRSGYPDRWLPLLPVGIHLPSRDEVLKSPKAHIAVLVLQIVAHLLLVGSQRTTPLLFDAIGDVGRGLLGWVHRVLASYTEVSK
eukprot:SM000228S07387  [mRNA]  locus=s228:134602:144556:- [translate_table: standard]